MFESRLSRAVFAVIFCAVNTSQTAHAGLQKEPIGLITPDHARAIYRHLVENHWVARSGLFMSFPDSNDRKLSQQASTYEQGAMGLLAIRMNDMDRARGIFSFLKEAWDKGPKKEGPRYGVRGLVNFYNVDFGSEGIEKRIHLGPNAWAGLFAARLANKTKDKAALQWALDVAYWIRNSLPHENGAVAMGPKDDPNGAPWTRVFSTENNLSYYAMLTELLRSTTLEPAVRNALTLERDRLENWLLTTAINRKTMKVYRGISPAGVDGIAALDTTTWLVSALTPAKIASRGIDVYRLMDTAAKAYEVKVAGLEGVDPTDFAEAAFTFAHDRAGPGESTRPDSADHRMIWFEGLGQYILALGQMADFAKQEKKHDLAKAYLDKARRLTQAYDQAALDHYPQRAAYPYATEGRFFRDGWRTPPDSAQGPASSLISGIWRIFAGLGTDPMAGNDVRAIQFVRVNAPEVKTVKARKPAVVYGTSEDMVVSAWNALARGDEDMALEQAQATVSEWSSWARQLQQRKQKEFGQNISYSGDPQDRKKIFSYWALNDVAAAYFIIGKVLHQKKDYASAGRAFQQIMNQYSLGQVWDPQGWFWSPADAVQSDYVASNPELYAWVAPQDVDTSTTTGKTPN